VVTAAQSAEDSDKSFTILIDSREQRPLSFGDIPVRRDALQTGDYSCICDDKDLRDVVAIERKSISDLLGCIGGQRERFERELTRLAQIPFRALVIEASIPDLLEATRDSKLHQRAVMGSVLAWTFKYGVAPIWCSGRPYAAAAVRTLLAHAARYAAAAQTPPPSMLERALLAELRPLRGAVCLTCSNAVFFVIGVDLSRERANEQGKNPAKSRVSKTPNGRPQAFADAPAPNPVRPSADGEESILPDLTDHGA
jgi:hypothetical protein